MRARVDAGLGAWLGLGSALEIVYWHVMMGVGQVVTRRVPGDKLREGLDQQKRQMAGS